MPSQKDVPSGQLERPTPDDMGLDRAAQPIPVNGEFKAGGGGLKGEVRGIKIAKDATEGEE